MFALQKTLPESDKKSIFSLETLQILFTDILFFHLRLKKIVLGRIGPSEIVIAGNPGDTREKGKSIEQIMELLRYLFTFHKSVRVTYTFLSLLSGIRITLKEMSLTSSNTLLAVHSLSMLTKFQRLQNIKGKNTRLL